MGTVWTWFTTILGAAMGGSLSWKLLRDTDPSVIAATGEAFGGTGVSIYLISKWIPGLLLGGVLGRGAAIAFRKHSSDNTREAVSEVENTLLGAFAIMIVIFIVVSDD